MSEERKPADDLREGFSLLLRAAKNAAKQVDAAKIDKGLDRAVTQVSRVVSNVSRVVADEINRMSTSSPPWARTGEPKEEGQEPPAEDEGEGKVWASEKPEDGAAGDAKADATTPSDGEKS